MYLYSYVNFVFARLNGHIISILTYLIHILTLSVICNLRESIKLLDIYCFDASEIMPENLHHLRESD